MSELQKSIVRKLFTTHGMSSSPEYGSWREMRQRCNNPNKPEFRNYGGRGIKVCPEWQNSFEAFFKDMGRKPSPEYSIERRDNSAGYSAGNCFWATRDEQNRNHRRNSLLEYKGEVLCITDWAIRAGVSRSTLQNRLNAGWPLDIALTREPSQKFVMPHRVASRKLSAEQATEIRRRRMTGESGPSLAAEFGISKSTVYAIATGETWKGSK